MPLAAHATHLSYRIWHFLVIHRYIQYMQTDRESHKRDLSATLRTLGLLLKSERVRRGMSREDLAEAADVSFRMVGKVERGETNDLISAWRLAQALGAEFSGMIAEAERNAG